MELKGYGAWSKKLFLEYIDALGPTWEFSESNIEDLMEHLKSDGSYDSFVEAYRKFLLDDSLSLPQKAEYYMDYFMPTEDAYKYFKWLWQNMVPDQPWPLEGKYPELESPQG